MRDSSVTAGASLNDAGSNAEAATASNHGALDFIFGQERPRLMAALGAITAGGVVEIIQPIGSSSVPGLAGSGVVDIGLLVWPFPVDAAALAGIGYQPVSGGESANQEQDVQRFEYAGEIASRRVQLWLVSAESLFLDHALLMRDYLRQDTAVQQAFVAARQSGEAEKAAFFARILPDAQRWWVASQGFRPLETITAEFQTAGFPWYISSGWALDLFLGRVTRVHRDVDVVVPFSHQMALQMHLVERGWGLVTPLDGRLEPWPRYMQLQMPRHQIHAHRDEAFIDLLLTEIEHGVWHYRRSPLIIRSVERMGLKHGGENGGIPYLAPELVLLFKSKNTSAVPRPQDQVDFEQALPLLEPERRAWLRWAILASDPDNPWLKVI